MNDLIYIGKITSSHGLKGELKVKSSFEALATAFKIGNTIIINKKNYLIVNYRPNNGNPLISLKDYNTIESIAPFLKQDIYIEKFYLNNILLDSDLLTYEVLTTTGKRGIIKEIFLASPKNKILRIYLDKEILIPLNSPMIRNIDQTKKEVLIELIDGM
jgi:16S rRNA processing protein RimM